MESFFKAKKSLYLWSDNTPYNVEANIILKRFFNGMHVKIININFNLFLL